MRIGRLLTAFALVPLVLLALACGSGGESGGTTEPPGNGGGNGGPPPPASADVSMVSEDDGYGYETHSFSPDEVTIGEGGEVTWSNDSGFPHNVTFTPKAGAPANIADRTSGSESRTFNTAGEFEYSCTNHAGMAGSVIVVED